MAKSQLIKDITINKINLEEGLQRLLLISSELNNEELKSWILGELNGYEDNDLLPSYRKDIGSRLIYSGINGSFQVSNNPLPVNYLPKDIRDVILQTPLRTSIRGIERLLEQKSRVGMDLTELAASVYKETGIQCYKIFKEYNLLSIEEVISKVKNKLIVLLLELENEFGSLDSLDIDIENISSEQFASVNASVRRIFFDGIGEEI